MKTKTVTKKPAAKLVAMNPDKEATSAYVVLADVETKSKSLITKLAKVPAKIRTQEDHDNCALLISNLNEYGKQAKLGMKEILDPLAITEKKVRDHFKPFLDRVTAQVLQYKSMLAEYHTWADAEKAKVLEDFSDGKIKKVATVLQRQASIGMASSENSSVRKVWTLEIEDPKKIPREYLVPDESLIREALKAGKTVPGAKWYQKNTVAL